MGRPVYLFCCASFVIGETPTRRVLLSGSLSKHLQTVHRSLQPTLPLTSIARSKRINPATVQLVH